MPEYLAPGVYIEETSFRPKTIEGVSTSTAGFVGPARFGPINGVPELLTSFTDFERIYGSIEKLEYLEKKSKKTSDPVNNYLAHSVRAFFENGGKRLYVSRVYSEGAEAGIAKYSIIDGSPVRSINIEARYPGKAGNMTISFVFHVGQNILGSENNYPVLRGAKEFDVVWVKDLKSPIISPPGAGTFYWLESYFDDTNKLNTFKLRRPQSAEDVILDLNTTNIDDVRIVTVSVIKEPVGRFGNMQSWENLSLHPDHKQSLGKILAKNPPDRSTELYVPLVFNTDLKNGVDIAETLFNQRNIVNDKNISDWIDDDKKGDAYRTYRIVLDHGNDGERPDQEKYKGDEDLSGRKSGLKAFEDIEDISIVAAPGFSHSYNIDYMNDANTIMSHLITHCERMKYRIAVLDSADKQIVSEVRKYRGQLDSKHAALYYPWVTVLDPVTGNEINLPPSGFVTGIYARNDVEYGVHKAPANEVVKLAIGFEIMLNKSQQDVLNPEAINCFRFFEGRGYRLWGARVVTSDGEWKYVNLRRYFAYLERSIDKGSQWVVFSNNSERIWANVKSTVEDFLFNEWKSGHLMGESPKEAYFVRCDRSTMTQNDLDNGRLICLIGVAPVRPAEFVIFRIGQKTLDSRA